MPACLQPSGPSIEPKPRIGSRNCDKRHQSVSRKLKKIAAQTNKFLGSLDAFLNFSSRLCVGGAVVLFAARTDDNDIAIILQKRSLHVSDEPGSFTVIPRVFHQPVINPAKEVDLPSTVYRECYEELFGGEEEPVNQGRHISSHSFLTQSPEVAELKRVRESQAEDNWYFKD